VDGMCCKEDVALWGGGEGVRSAFPADSRKEIKKEKKQREYRRKERYAKFFDGRCSFFGY